jgi:hypothetical protein
VTAGLPARERDVRVKGATFGHRPDPDAGALDPGGERRKRRFRNCQRILTFVDGGMTLVDGR